MGTTVAPWQLFFQQSIVADKKLRSKDLKWARLDTLLGTIAISLSSAYAYAEVAGWKHSLQTKFRDAPVFYVFYALAVLAAAAIVLIPNAPLQIIIIGVQVLAGLMLPSAIIFLQILLNDKALLGDKYINKKWNNYINWAIIIILFILSFVLAVQILLPNVFK